MNRNDLLQYALAQYGTVPEYPWISSPNSAVLRHDGNKKWYGLIMDISGKKLGLPGEEIVDVINVKCDPLLIGSLLKLDGFFPAYHMNKTYWITILLDGSVSGEEITHLLHMSYALTGGK